MSFKSSKKHWRALVLIVGIRTSGFGGVQRYAQDLAKLFPEGGLLDLTKPSIRSLFHLIRETTLVLTHWRCFKFIGNLPRKSLIIIFHGTDIFSCPAEILTRIGTSKNVVKVVVPSRYTQSLLEAHIKKKKLSFDMDKITIINHGSIACPLKRGDGRKKNRPIKVLSLLRLEYSEKILSLISLINWWRVNITAPTTFTLVGSGVGFERLQNFFQTKGFLNVQVIDGTNFQTTDYQKFDLFALPNLSEGFGYAVLDSLMNGVPVIIDRKSGAGDFCTNENSLYFDCVQSKGTFTETDLENMLSVEAKKIVATVSDFKTEQMRQRYSEIINA